MPRGEDGMVVAVNKLKADLQAAHQRIEELEDDRQRAIDKLLEDIEQWALLAEGDPEPAYEALQDWVDTARRDLSNLIPKEGE